jgi:hypothetical protein
MLSLWYLQLNSGIFDNGKGCHVALQLMNKKPKSFGCFYKFTYGVAMKIITVSNNIGHGA